MRNDIRNYSTPEHLLSERLCLPSLRLKTWLTPVFRWNGRALTTNPRSSPYIRIRLHRINASTLYVCPLPQTHLLGAETEMRRGNQLHTSRVYNSRATLLATRTKWSAGRPLQTNPMPPAFSAGHPRLRREESVENGRHLRLPQRRPPPPTARWR